MKQRVLSAIVLIAIVAVCIFLGTVTRILLFTVAGLLCTYELCKNFKIYGITVAPYVMYVYLIGQALLAYFVAGNTFYIAWFVACIYFAFIYCIIHPKAGGQGVIFSLAGMIYPCALFGAIFVILMTPYWSQTLLIACISTWLCDSFALFGGMKFGKHKFAPHVSPNKSIEGCICGALASALGGIVLYFLFRSWSPLPMWFCIITALLCSTLGQFGDLAESLIKRMMDIKDFSNLIPGHGGMFDRVDSLLFSIPSAYFCLFIFFMLQ